MELVSIFSIVVSDQKYSKFKLLSDFAISIIEDTLLHLAPGVAPGISRQGS